MSSKTKAYIALHAMLVLYSLSGICGKLAAQFDFLSVGFIVCYAGMIAVLGIYAIGWQQVIKRLPLTLAYANRAVTVVWGIVWGVVLFNEPLDPFKIVGALVVLAGVALFAYADAEDDGVVNDAQLADGSLLDEMSATEAAVSISAPEDETAVPSSAPEDGERHE